MCTAWRGSGSSAGRSGPDGPAPCQGAAEWTCCAAIHVPAPACPWAAGATQGSFLMLILQHDLIACLLMQDALHVEQ